MKHDVFLIFVLINNCLIRRLKPDMDKYGMCQWIDEAMYYIQQ